MSLKVSLPGFNVKTATPEQLAIDSEYDSLKLIVKSDSYYFGEMLVNFKDNPPVGTYNVLVYKHKFSYIPFYYFFFDVSKSSKILGSNTGLETGTTFFNDVFNNQYFQVTDTIDGFKFDYIVANNSFDMTDQFFSFRYFVFVNDGI